MSWPDWIENSPEYEMDVPVFDIEHRHRIEREKLASAWSTLAIDPAYGIVEKIIGSIEPISGGPIRDFEIIVPDHYPYESPLSFAIGWHVGGEHCWPDRNEMCLWQDNDWSPRYTLAYAVGKTYVWIHKHEEWLGSGIWPGNQQIHF